MGVSTRARASPNPSDSRLDDESQPNGNAVASTTEAGSPLPLSSVCWGALPKGVAETRAAKYFSCSTLVVVLASTLPSAVIHTHNNKQSYMSFLKQALYVFIKQFSKPVVHTQL